MQPGWALAALIAAGTGRARSVKVKAGKTYALRIKVYKAEFPLTAELLERVKPDLEKFGIREAVLRVVHGVTVIDAIITAPRDIEYPTGRLKVTIGGYDFEFEYVWAKPVATEPNV